MMIPVSALVVNSASRVLPVRCEGLCRLLSHRNLNFCQPPAVIILIPDPVQIAFPNLPGDFISVFFDKSQNGFIGLRQGSVGTPVENAGA